MKVCKISKNKKNSSQFLPQEVLEDFISDLNSGKIKSNKMIILFIDDENNEHRWWNSGMKNKMEAVGALEYLKQILIEDF